MQSIQGVPSDRGLGFIFDLDKGFGFSTALPTFSEIKINLTPCMLNINFSLHKVHMQCRIIMRMNACSTQVLIDHSLQFLGGWYEQRTVPIPILQPEGFSCGYSIYGETGSESSIHEWHIQTMPKVDFICLHC